MNLQAVRAHLTHRPHPPSRTTLAVLLGDQLLDICQPLPYRWQDSPIDQRR
ncbi:MAG TPA: hypothetical protein VFN19_02900 [Candidatus Nanopelagicales bacterium]|jgi:hypothetical protein|nr:hypothetical protein [Candidatus Nanopelagicales bacterium]